MTSPLPEPLTDAALAELRAADDRTQPGPVTPAQPPRSLRTATRVRAANVLRRGLARLNAPTLEPLFARVSEAEAQLAQTRSSLAEVNADLQLLRPTMQPEIDANRINNELLKGEFRQLLSQVEELGMAFAPATGLAGAGARFAELREAVNSLERRIRNQSLAGDGVSATHAPETDIPPVVAAAEDKSSSLFNYVGFERRFRGDPEEILDTLVERYGALLSAHQPVVDVGCGRGELLGRLSEDGVEVIGIEPDAGMVADARARGITVHQMFAGEYLRSVPDHSLGSIISTHVVEHLRLDDLIELIELAERKLVPGGVFIAETPNPASLIVLGNSYIMDPTHVWPLHPSLLSFLAESAGFRDVRLNFFSPATGYQLKPIDVPTSDENLRTAIDQINVALGQLNDVLFGPQDYAMIATTAPAAAATA